MAKTPQDLALLIEAILTAEAREKAPEGGYGSVMKGKEGWEGMKVGFVESTWGGGDEQKWRKGPVVSWLGRGGGKSLMMAEIGV